MGNDGDAYGCEVLFGPERAQDLRQMIEGATQAPCPCRAGHPCPLLPPVGIVALDIPTLRRLRVVPPPAA